MSCQAAFTQAASAQPRYVAALDAALGQLSYYSSTYRSVLALRKHHASFPAALADFAAWAEPAHALYREYVEQYRFSLEHGGRALQQLLEQPFEQCHVLACVMAPSVAWAQLSALARDKLSTQLRRADRTTFYWDAVRDLDSLAGVPDAPALRFDAAAIVYRDYFSLTLRHRFLPAQRAMSVELLLLGTHSTSRPHTLAVCGIERPGRSLMFPPFRKATLTLIDRSPTGLVLESARSDTCLLVECNDPKQMQLWRKHITALFGHRDGSFGTPSSPPLHQNARLSPPRHTPQAAPTPSPSRASAAKNDSRASPLPNVDTNKPPSGLGIGRLASPAFNSLSFSQTFGGIIECDSKPFLDIDFDAPTMLAEPDVQEYLTQSSKNLFALANFGRVEIGVPDAKAPPAIAMATLPSSTLSSSATTNSTTHTAPDSPLANTDKEQPTPPSFLSTPPSTASDSGPSPAAVKMRQRIERELRGGHSADSASLCSSPSLLSQDDSETASDADAHSARFSIYSWNSYSMPKAPGPPPPIPLPNPEQIPDIASMDLDAPHLASGTPTPHEPIALTVGSIAIGPTVAAADCGAAAQAPGHDDTAREAYTTANTNADTNASTARSDSPPMARAPAQLPSASAPANEPAPPAEEYVSLCEDVSKSGLVHEFGADEHVNHNYSSPSSPNGQTRGPPAHEPPASPPSSASSLAPAAVEKRPSTPESAFSFEPKELSAVPRVTAARPPVPHAPPLIDTDTDSDEPLQAPVMSAALDASPRSPKSPSHFFQRVASPFRKLSQRRADSPKLAQSPTLNSLLDNAPSPQPARPPLRAVSAPVAKRSELPQPQPWRAPARQLPQIQTQLHQPQPQPQLQPLLQLQKLQQQQQQQRLSREGHKSKSDSRNSSALLDVIEEEEHDGADPASISTSSSSVSLFTARSYNTSSQKSLASCTIPEEEDDADSNAASTAPTSLSGSDVDSPASETAPLSEGSRPISVVTSTPSEATVEALSGIATAPTDNRLSSTTVKSMSSESECDNDSSRASSAADRYSLVSVKEEPIHISKASSVSFVKPQLVNSPSSSTTASKYSLNSHSTSMTSMSSANTFCGMAIYQGLMVVSKWEGNVWKPLSAGKEVMVEVFVEAAGGTVSVSNGLLQISVNSDSKVHRSTALDIQILQSGSSPTMFRLSNRRDSAAFFKAVELSRQDVTHQSLLYSRHRVGYASSHSGQSSYSPSLESSSPSFATNLTSHTNGSYKNNNCQAAKQQQQSNGPNLLLINNLECKLFTRRFDGTGFASWSDNGVCNLTVYADSDPVKKHVIIVNEQAKKLIYKATLTARCFKKAGRVGISVSPDNGEDALPSSSELFKLQFRGLREANFVSDLVMCA